MKYSVFLTLAFLACASNAFSQTKHDYSGKNFWVAFPQNAQSENGSQIKLAIDIVGEPGTNVKIDMQGKTKRGKIPAERFLELVVDSDFQVQGAEITTAKGILVESDRNVSVFVFDMRQESSDSYSAIPTNELGTEYVVAGYDVLTSMDRSFSTQCDVIAADNNTLIHCTSPRNVESSSAVTWDVTLKRGEVYQLRTHPGVTATDLTGTRITSNNPIAFLTGHHCAQVPSNVSFCNVLVEQEPSVDNLGTEYIAPKITMKDKYSIRVVSTIPATELSINGTQVKTLEAGESYTCDTLTSSSVIRTSQPALVCEYIQSHEADKKMTGDPSMFILASAPSFIKECSIYVPTMQHGPLALGSYDTITEANGLTKIYIPKHTVAASQVIVQNMDQSSSSQRKLELLNPVVGVSKVVMNGSRVYGSEPVRIQQSVQQEIPTSSSSASESALGGGWQHFLTVVTDNSRAGTIIVDGNVAKPIASEIIANSKFRVLQFSITAGAHKITSTSPFALYSYGFGMDGNNYDAYAHSAGQMLNVGTAR